MVGLEVCGVSDGSASFASTAYEVAANSREVNHDWDLSLLQMCTGTNTTTSGRTSTCNFFRAKGKDRRTSTSALAESLVPPRKQ